MDRGDRCNHLCARLLAREENTCTLNLLRIPRDQLNKARDSAEVSFYSCFRLLDLCFAALISIKNFWVQSSFSTSTEWQCSLSQCARPWTRLRRKLLGPLSVEILRSNVTTHVLLECGLGWVSGAMQCDVAVVLRHAESTTARPTQDWQPVLMEYHHFMSKQLVMISMGSSFLLSIGICRVPTLVVRDQQKGSLLSSL